MSLSANDSCVSGPAAFGCFNAGALAFSSINPNADTAAFLASAEGSVAVTPTRWTTLRGFAGVTYDSRVPGIAAPDFTAPVIPIPPMQGTPAVIKYEAKNGWYAGGGVTVKLN